MIRRILISVVLSVPLLAAGAPASAAITQTEQFRGEGSSSFGFAYYYAVGDALSQARAAGYDAAPDCEEIDSYTSPGGYEAWVLLECTR